MGPGEKDGREAKTLNVRGGSQRVSGQGKEETLEQKMEREWKSIRCPGSGDKTVIMAEWDILSEKGRILKKSLRQIDCHHPPLTKFGGEDCKWGCEGVIGKKGR